MSHDTAASSAGQLTDYIMSYVTAASSSAGKLTDHIMSYDTAVLCVLWSAIDNFVEQKLNKGKQYQQSHKTSQNLSVMSLCSFPTKRN